MDAIWRESSLKISLTEKEKEEPIGAVSGKKRNCLYTCVCVWVWKIGLHIKTCV